MPNNDDAIYNRVAVLRAEKSISRQELADALGVNYQTLGFLERGDYNPSLKLALDASAFFRVPVEAIFSRTPFPPLRQVLQDAAVAEARQNAAPLKSQRSRR